MTNPTDTKRAALVAALTLFDVVDLVVRIRAIYDYRSHRDATGHPLRYKTCFPRTSLHTASIIKEVKERLKHYYIVTLVQPPSTCEPVDFAFVCAHTLYKSVVAVKFEDYGLAGSLCPVCSYNGPFAGNSTAQTGKNQRGYEYRLPQRRNMHRLFSAYVNIRVLARPLSHHAFHR